MEDIYPGIVRLRFGSPEKFTPSFFKRPASDRILSSMPVPKKSHLDIDCIEFRKTSRGCLLEIPLSSGEDIYGFGSQMKSFRQNGKKRTIRVNSDPPSDTGETHAPVPYYLSTAGYGILVDTARYAVFYCGTHVKRSSGRNSGGGKAGCLSDRTEELYGGSDSQSRKVVMEIPSAKGIDIYLFYGDTVLDALRRYILFSGGGCFPPIWALGIRYRGYTKLDQEQVIQLCESFRNDNIPCDVFGLEPGWQSKAYSCSYEWDKVRFPSPDRLRAGLKELGYKISLWEHAFVNPSSPVYGKLRPFSGDYLVFNGLVPDFSIPKAAKIFADYHEKEFVRNGISCFKLDECDNSDYIRSPWSFPENSSFPGGMDGEQMHSLLGILYQKTIDDVYIRNNIRSYGEVRSSHCFSAPYPYVLYSDLYDHREFVRALVNCGFSGMLWAPEVKHGLSKEDFIHRLQTAVLSPLALVNAWTMVHPPWKQFRRAENQRGELMGDRKDLIAVVKKIFQFRMSLVPYLYSAFLRYHLEGIPPFRALVLDYPDDLKCREIDDEYLVGDSILAAPLFAEQQKREVYLPSGGWFDFNTRKFFQGNATYEISPKLDETPIFVKENSILPLSSTNESIDKDTCFNLTVLAFGDNPEPFKLCIDDGTTFNYENGDSGWMELSWDRTAGKGVAKIRSNCRIKRYRISKWDHVQAASVSVAGACGGEVQ
ncbi:MAG: hypothetical protein A2X48_23445 [Lentisphaerae bacterium GWF2_49_21]|nr:MAG: hypothetical protein A2X48_23445 [Lentisphaerae bacterium GWF2_49_21]